MAARYQRIPYGIFFKEPAGFKDTYAGAENSVFLEAHRLVPESASKTVILFTHPIGGGAYLPMVTALAAAGHHVIYANTRYRGNDSALIMEKCVVDLGAAVSHARRELGYERVILGGWSGGGSLSLFYQAEAENPRLTSTPAGDPPDLTQAGLEPADAVLLLSSHVSRAVTLTEWLDASIVDEERPFDRDPELNLYDRANPNQPPYSEDFLARYATAQIERNRRITRWVRGCLDELRSSGKSDHERGFTTHGTMAAPCWLDPAVDPNQRKPGWCYLGDPEVVNDGPVGLARFATLRSWLSQWSYDESRGDGVECAGRISVPVLVIGNLADDACPPSHARRLYAAVADERKKLVEIEGATHYYFGQRDKMAEAIAACEQFLEEHELIDS